MVLQRSVYFSPGGCERGLYIYLPNGYERGQRQYPVLYMFDGQNLFFDGDATYGTCMGMREFLNEWEKDVIVVGIQCAGDDWTRVHEYCPFVLEMEGYGLIQGRGEATLDWLIHELKPMIDRDYRTIPFRENTGIAGCGMGGLLSIYGLIHFNRWISKAAAISPSILPAMDALEQELSQRSLSSDSKLFLSWGTEEADPETTWYLAQNIMALEGIAQNRRVRTYHHCQRNGRHSEADWRAQIPVWMHFLWN